MSKEYFSFNELKDMFFWQSKRNPSNDADKIAYAKKRGVIIERVATENKLTHYFKIISLDIEGWLSVEEIYKKYNIGPKEKRYNMEQNAFIEYCKKRGLILKSKRAHKILYKVLDDSIILDKDWVPYINDPSIEVTKAGYARRTNSKVIFTARNQSGYAVARKEDGSKVYLVHRAIMETFCPQSNSDELVVDHINGCRADNRIENLRWSTQTENVLYKGANWQPLRDKISLCVDLFGYEELCAILDKAISEKESSTKNF